MQILLFLVRRDHLMICVCVCVAHTATGGNRNGLSELMPFEQDVYFNLVHDILTRAVTKCFRFCSCFCLCFCFSLCFCLFQVLRNNSMPSVSSYKGAAPQTIVASTVDILESDKAVLDSVFHTSGGVRPPEDWFIFNLVSVDCPRTCANVCERVWFGQVVHVQLDWVGSQRWYPCAGLLGVFNSVDSNVCDRCATYFKILR